MSQHRILLLDYCIGAVVLLMAIALPYSLFTRTEQLHRAATRVSASGSQHSMQTSDGPRNRLSNAAAAASAKSHRLPLTAGKATPAHQTASTAGHGASRAPLTVATPAAGASQGPPVGAPVAVLSVKPAKGTAPLTVTADASASTDSPQTPIVNVLIDCGSGSGASEVSRPWITSCIYATGGSYTITVEVFDIDTKSSQSSAMVTVS